MTETSGSLNPNKVALFLQSADSERLRTAASIMAGAAALNWEVVVVLLGDALRKHIEDGLEMGLTETEDPSQPSRLMRSAVEFGRISLVACSADARRTGYDDERIRKRVDDVLAMSTILIRTRDAGTKLYL